MTADQAGSRRACDVAVVGAGTAGCYAAAAVADAGYVAGAQAGLLARAVDAARNP